ncbi:Methyltransferase domain-containing protein [Amycolatopsis arida]|uniref:Methyltransferase domain-containing protein n=1 Tax=Amycolatopsis arida TaxID=587909 RepID=A0A1I5VA08_9PSEU|nr:class I SAM-dependent methyltransferase [Amycolatopsis arida]TDX91204.1 methyltransferase family protein [Amycolatopsis arida]SFQ04335.1 Methyltransferase domain-containing protein [Amycolatopsis arida]
MIKDSAAELFDGLAATYDGDDYHRIVAERLVDGVPVPAGAGTGSDGGPNTLLDRVLDIATGTGEAAFAAVRRLGARHVLAVDIAPGMIAEARAKASTRDPDRRIEWRVAPGVPAPVTPASVDLVLCASALHFLGTAALVDWRRVLRPGGRVAFTLPCASTFAASGAAAALLAPDLRPPATAGEAAASAATAGFTEVSVERLVVRAGGRARAVYVVHALAGPTPGPV